MGKTFIPTLPEYVMERRAICESCEQRLAIGKVNLCKSCGCIVQFKTRVKDTVCPQKKW